MVSFNQANHSHYDHSTHKGLLPCIADMSDFPYGDLGHNPIKHSSTQLDWNPGTER